MIKTINSNNYSFLFPSIQIVMEMKKSSTTYVKKLDHENKKNLISTKIGAQHHYKITVNQYYIYGKCKFRN